MLFHALFFTDNDFFCKKNACKHDKRKSCRKTHTKTGLVPVNTVMEKTNWRHLSHVRCADLLLKVMKQTNATKVLKLLYPWWMYSLWPIMKGCAYCCANTDDLHTHTYTCMHTHTYAGQAAARLSSPKIIRHQNEFSCCFFAPPPVHFIHVQALEILANAVNMHSS